MNTTVKLLENEKVLFECKPKKSYVGYWMLSRILRFAFLILVLSIYLSNFIHSPNYLTHLAFAALIPFAIILVVMIPMGVGITNGRSYLFTDKRVIIQAKFFSYNKKVLTYDQIIDADMSRSVLRSMLGVSAVLLQQGGFGNLGRSGFASGRGGSNLAMIDGISHEQADKILELVSEQMAKK